MSGFFLLVVDDNADMYNLLRYATRVAYQNEVKLEYVNTVPNLFDKLAEDQLIPDLVLLDYYLQPEPYTGADVLTWIKQHAHLQKLPVIVWSSLPNGPEAKNCLQLGAQNFITKADAMSDMVQFVKQLIEGHTPQNQ